VAPTFAPGLLDFLESRAIGKWSGSVWREVLGDADPLRPNLRGARWNPPGVEALYCSLDGSTAAAEVDHLVSLQSVPVRRRRQIRIEVELTRVVDLAELSPLVTFGIESAHLLGPNVDAPRMIGHAISWLGCAGLIVPSARHPGNNLVIYTNQMAPTDRVDIANAPA
jgi:RES domain-containing protein